MDHYTRRVWTGVKNITNIPSYKILLPNKLDFTKNFVEAMDGDVPAFNYATQAFFRISLMKPTLRRGYLWHPQIRGFWIWQCAWGKRQSDMGNLRMVVTHFLGNKRADNYPEIVNELLKAYKPFA